MNAITFPLTSNCNEAHARLRSLAHRMGPLTRGEIILIDSVRRALESGLYYTKDVLAFVVRDLNVSEEAQAIQAKHVEGGLMGMETYYARDYVEKVAARVKDEEAAARIVPEVGKRLGAIVLNDGKLINAWTIVRMSHRGSAVTIQGKRGKHLVEWTGGASRVERGMLRAIEQKASNKARRDQKAARRASW
jgi:hypothetical protein